MVVENNGGRDDPAGTSEGWWLTWICHENVDNPGQCRVIVHNVRVTTDGSDPGNGAANIPAPHCTAACQLPGHSSKRQFLMLSQIAFVRVQVTG